MPTASYRHNDAMPATVGLRCDASGTMGVGHVIRLLALADELLERGCQVVLLGRVEGVPWVSQEVARRPLTVLPAPAEAAELARLAVGHGLDAVVLDGYGLDPASGATLRAAGVTVLAVVDGAFGDAQEADLYLDQNLDAELQSPHAGDQPAQLLGLDYVLFRDEVLRRRRDTVPAPGEPPRLLVVFGGTDAHGGVGTLVPLVLDTGLAVEVVAVCPDESVTARLAALPLVPGQELRTLAPTPDLAAVAAGCDVAVTAAGSSVWELCCLGVPMGVVEVADNQRLGYRAVLDRGIALGLGRLADLRADELAREGAVPTLRELLTDVPGRVARAGRAQALVDGRGRSRVADRLLGTLSRDP